MKKTSGAFLGLLAVLLLLPSQASAGKIQGAILDLIGGRGIPAAKAGSSRARHATTVSLDAQGRLLCWVTTGPGSFEEATRGKAFSGLEVDGELTPCAQVWVPLSEITRLADQPGILQVGLPPSSVALEASSAAAGATVSEALSGMRVPEFWSRADGGRGVRIGIIDAGFTGYEGLLGSELPASVTVRSFYHNDNGDLDFGGDNTIHGTACAEIVHDVAPEAELYLANVRSPVDLLNATNWMIDQGVEVISHSIGWFFGAGDGTGFTESVAAHARDNGILWVNAAGNSAEGHWSGPYTDVNANAIAEIGTEHLELMPIPGASFGSRIGIYLLWDRWPYSIDVQFEIDLMGSGVLLSSSQADPYQDNAYAVRLVIFDVDHDRNDLALRVRNVAGDPTGVHLRLIRADNFSFRRIDRMPEGSIAMPADAPEVLSVGAYAWESGGLEPFSSRGPTTTGLAKPEILGPDSVSTYTYLHAYPPGSFQGTSAACPHVAGLLALMLAASPRGAFYDARWTPDEVLRLLKENAARMPDSLQAASGWGRARLPLLQSSTTAPQLVVAGAPGSNPLRLRLMHAPATAASVQVFDVLGRLRMEIPGRRIDRDTFEYSLEARSGIHFEAGRYWAREPRTSATVSIFWPGRTRLTGSP